MHWTIAGCQMEVGPDPRENLSRMVQSIAEASANLANVICFPESCLIDDEQDARSITKELAQLADAARNHNIHVIFGTYLQDKSGKIRNQVLVIEKTGTIAMRYNKRHKYREETEVVTAGRRNRLFTLDGIPCAVIICWDYAFPEDIRKLAILGTDVIFCPSYLLSHPQTYAVVEHIPQIRAFDTMSYFVMVDAYAPETFQRSKICHPLQCLAKISSQAGMMYANIDTQDLKQLRSEFVNL